MILHPDTEVFCCMKLARLTDGALCKHHDLGSTYFLVGINQSSQELCSEVISCVLLCIFCFTSSLHQKLLGSTAWKYTWDSRHKSNILTVRFEGRKLLSCRRNWRGVEKEAGVQLRC